MTTTGWGAGPFGDVLWGDGGGPGFSFVAAIARRENVIRIAFNVPIYFSRILDAEDGSVPARYAVTPIAGTVGYDGTPARAVSVVAVSLPSEDVSPEDYGRVVDVTLDRPMTPYPARYTIAINNLFSADLLSTIVSASREFDAAYRLLAQPTLDTTPISRDFASPQTRSAMLDPLPDPNNPLNLGVFVITDSGDYAFDEGITNLKKRILRRLITTPGGFAHLPNYGVGVADHGKQLATNAIINQLAVTAETQIRQEPDVAKVRVRPLVDPNVPGLVRFQIVVVPRSGPAQMLDVPFQAR